MARIEDYEGQKPSWCPGCGNFGIQKAFKEAMVEMGIEPYMITVVSGIGQSGKFPHYIRCNTFNGLHGRSLPVATGLRLANHEQPVLCFQGDGDCYGEGGNHLVHSMRRNINVKLFVHDNQIYGLTKGQASPTTSGGTVMKIQPFGVQSESLNPIALAVALDCSFVARSFAGDTAHLKGTIKEAMSHKGFSLVDILQPCVTFNKVNTYEWYRKRCYHIENGYDPTDRVRAFARALEFGDSIPLGVIYRNSRRAYEEGIPVIREEPLINQPPDVAALSGILDEFY